MGSASEVLLIRQKIVIFKITWWLQKHVCFFNFLIALPKPVRMRLKFSETLTSSISLWYFHVFDTFYKSRFKAFNSTLQIKKLISIKVSFICLYVKKVSLIVFIVNIGFNTFLQYSIRIGYPKEYIWGLV